MQLVEYCTYVCACICFDIIFFCFFKNEHALVQLAKLKRKGDEDKYNVDNADADADVGAAVDVVDDDDSKCRRIKNNIYQLNCKLNWTLDMRCDCLFRRLCCGNTTKLYTRFNNSECT